MADANLTTIINEVDHIDSLLRKYEQTKNNDALNKAISRLKPWILSINGLWSGISSPKGDEPLLQQIGDKIKGIISRTRQTETKIPSNPLETFDAQLVSASRSNTVVLNLLQVFYKD